MSTPEHLLIVTTDRLSAFDVVLPDPIPFKGEVLTRISEFWFGKTRHIVPNQLTELKVEDVIPDRDERAQLAGRSMVVKKLNALPGRSRGAGLSDRLGLQGLQARGSICGISLPAGLQMADALPEPIFTPASKAPAGQHDENVDFDTMVKAGRTGTMRRKFAGSRWRYTHLPRTTRARAISSSRTPSSSSAPTRRGNLILIDEALTPDSSRFWPMASYKPGISPPSFDKQFIRDYLESLHWNKKPPAPHLPPDIIARTSDNYRNALELLTA